MTAKNKFYITTAIDYVNARPHCGHAFEKTLADAIARWNRLHKKEVFFLTGVDENAQKNVQAAENEGIPVKEFIDKNTSFFIELCKKLNISHTGFVRTTAEDHARVVQKILQKILKKGDIYKGLYEGLYCVGCETYYTEKDLVNGKCPEHDYEPELRKEEAYFFKLSKYKDYLLKFIPQYTIPESRANEVLTRIKEDGLSDICISRKGAKWGIDFPNDKDYKVWVWIDALINYISGLDNKEDKYWPADLHVIGKGINWFHSVIWPAILIAADYKLPEQLFVHGYLNVRGKKASKSLGNVVDPLELLEKYPSDTVRYSLFRCSVFEDTDYSEKSLVERHNNELANKLGNLVSRVSALAEQYGLEKAKPIETESLLKKISAYFERYELERALAEIFSFIDSINTFIQDKKPWETHNKQVLYQASSAIKDASILLSPFLPETAEKIAKTFSFEISLKAFKTPLSIANIKKSPILFKKIDMTFLPFKHQESAKSSAPVVAVKSPVQSFSKAPVSEGIADIIDFAHWEKIDLRVAKIEKAEDIEGADKLYKLTVSLGSEKRTLCAGLKKFYTKQELEGKLCIVFANLAPRVMKGITSQGMILAVVSEDESQVVLLAPEKDIKEGSKVR